MNIREYTDHIKRHLKSKNNNGNFNWRKAYLEKGYPNVLLGSEGHTQWQEVHAWCKEHIGTEHYIWTGSRFWFDNVDNAALFALKWS
jgi:hypothetical protein